MVFRYAGLFTVLMTIIILFKAFLFPLLIWNFLPKSDFGSALYEVLIMCTGAITILVLVGLGYLSKTYFSLSPFLHYLINLLILLPIWIQSVRLEYKQVYTMNLFIRYLYEWGELLGEPIRLLFFVYPWTNAIAVFIFFILISFGRSLKIERAEEARTVRYVNQE